jgi:DNA-binding Lrp family transcriptional regulator
MDEFDRRLLRMMQDSNLVPAHQVATAIGLSASAVQRRIHRLRETGVIAADVSVVEPRSVGRPMTFVVEVEMERERGDLIDAFRRQMRASPEIQQCYYVTGEADFILIVTAADMADYERTTRELFFDNPNVRRFRTSVVMDRVKVGLTVPVA